MDKGRPPALVRWARTFWGMPDLLVVHCRTADFFPTKSKPVKKIEEGLEDLFEFLAVVRRCFLEDLAAIDPRRIHDCYSRRGEAPTLDQAESPIASYAEAFDAIWQDALANSGRTLNLLLQDAGEPASPVDTVAEMLSGCVRLSQPDRIIWWQMVVEFFSQAVDQPDDSCSIELLSDLDLRSHYMQPFYSDEKVPSSRWKAIFCGLSKEESMLRVDYPGLLDSEGLQPSTIAAVSAAEVGPKSGQNGQQNGQSDEKTKKSGGRGRVLPQDVQIQRAARFIRDQRRNFAAHIGQRRSKKALISEFLNQPKDSPQVAALARQLQPDRYGWLLEVDD